MAVNATIVLLAPGPSLQVTHRYALSTQAHLGIDPEQGSHLRRIERMPGMGAHERSAGLE